MPPRRRWDKVAWAGLRTASTKVNSCFHSPSPEAQVEASLETKTLLKLIEHKHVLQVAMSSCDTFGDNMDSTTAMETRLKTHCTTCQGRKVTWFCCSISKGHIPDKAGVSDAGVYLAGQGLCHLKRGHKDSYEVGWVNITVWENLG